MGTDWVEKSTKRAGPYSWRSGEIGATLFGLDEQMTLRRAVEQILANLESAEFNSLEIMRVASEASKRFLGVRYVTVSAQSRDRFLNSFSLVMFSKRLNAQAEAAVAKSLKMRGARGIQESAPLFRAKDLLLTDHARVARQITSMNACIQPDFLRKILGARGASRQEFRPMPVRPGAD